MEPKKGYVDTDHGQIHYRYGGKANQQELTIVLFHQAPSSSRMFDEAIALLQDEFHVVAPDLPGFGHSFAPESVESVEYYAETLIDALDTLDVETFHAVGHHTGASVVAHIATEHPERVDTTTFVGPPYLTESGRAERLDKLESGAYDFPPLDSEGEYLLHHWEKYDAEGGDLERQHRRALDSILARGNYPSQAYRVVFEQDFPGRFGQIDAPRMIMAARDDALWDAFQRAQSDHPSVRAVELSGGNFEPSLDAEQFVDSLVEFLSDHGYT